jgi:hypothetical protein
MTERQPEYASLGIEAIPGGLAGSFREADRKLEPGGRYRQPPNVLRVEGLVAIALRWMAGTPKSR